MSVTTFEINIEKGAEPEDEAARHRNEMGNGPDRIRHARLIHAAAFGNGICQFANGL